MVKRSPKKLFHPIQPKSPVPLLQLWNFQTRRDLRLVGHRNPNKYLIGQARSFDHSQGMCGSLQKFHHFHLHGHCIWKHGLPDCDLGWIWNTTGTFQSWTSNLSFAFSLAWTSSHFDSLTTVDHVGPYFQRKMLFWIVTWPQHTPKGTTAIWFNFLCSWQQTPKRCRGVAGGFPRDAEANVHYVLYNPDFGKTMISRTSDE